MNFIRPNCTVKIVNTVTSVSHTPITMILKNPTIPKKYMSDDYRSIITEEIIMF